jgi:phosphoribosylanthranilate isomerase
MFGSAESEPGRTRVKICGMTNGEDALVAIEAGADALGWNLFSGSKRFVSPCRAIAIIESVPRSVAHVAILVDPTFDEAVTIAESGAFAALQLHGSETPEFCGRLAERGVRFAKAIAVNAASATQSIDVFFTDTIVLDSVAQGCFGGTGQTFPWELARDLRQRHGSIRLVLAGGLTSANVAEAIRLVRPFAVDVTTGVEAAAGRKDHALLRAFIAAAHAA